jgi:capsular polysaccharide biosynthesis protein
MIRIAILRILESYFRHRWLYLIPIVLLALIGLVSTVTADAQYFAGGIIYVQKESFLGTLTNVRDVPFSFSTPSQQTVGQIMELMQTNAFVRSVVQETKLEERMNEGDFVVNEVFSEVRRSVWAQSIGDNQVAINAIHSDPELAAQLSNGVITRYVQWQINLDQVQSGAAEDFMDDLVVTYSDELEQARDNLRAYLEAHPEPLRGDRTDTEILEVDRLQDLLSLAGSRYARALEQQEGARLATAQAEADVRQTYFVVDAPSIPTNPAVSLRQQAINSLIFVVVGAVVAAGAVAGGAVLDRSFRFPIDVEYGLALPVLSTVPDVRPKPSRLAFLRRRSKKPVTEKVGQKMSSPLADDDAIEAAV